MRRLVVPLVLLVALLVAADRLALAVASGAVASALRESGGLRTDPSVSIAGFPFLTQVVDGRYDRIELSATSLSRGGVRVARLHVTVTGLQLGLAEALGGTVSSVPVDGLAATALVTYADLVAAGRLPGGQITFVPGGVRVTARLVVLGRTVTASALSSVRLVRGTIVVTARSVTVVGTSSSALRRAVQGRLDLRVPVGTLPFGLALTGLGAGADGLRLTARSGPTVLRVPR